MVAAVNERPGANGYKGGIELFDLGHAHTGFDTNPLCLHTGCYGTRIGTDEGYHPHHLAPQFRQFLLLATGKEAVHIHVHDQWILSLFYVVLPVAHSKAKVG